MRLTKPLLRVDDRFLQYKVLKTLDILEEGRCVRVGVLRRGELKTHVVGLLTSTVEIVLVDAPCRHLRCGELEDASSCFVEHRNILSSASVHLRVAEVDGGREVIRHGVKKESHNTYPVPEKP